MPSSSSLLMVRSFSSMSSRATSLAPDKKLLQAQIDAMRQPAVGIERAGKAVHADAAALEFQLLDALGDAVGPGALARPDVADPILRAAPAFQEGRHQHEAGRIALAREHQHVEFGIAADRTEIARIGDAEVPHQRPAPQHQAIEIARRHVVTHRGPAPVALAQRQPGEFESVAHVLLRYAACSFSRCRLSR